MVAALRYRWAQALVLLVLSALVTTCLVLAPLYTRALEQAAAATLIAEATVQESGLRLVSTSSADPALALPPGALEAIVPPQMRADFGAALASTSVTVRRMPLLGQPGGRLLARDGSCAHVRFTAGRCPTARGEIAVSAEQERRYEMPVGTTLLVGEFDGAVSLPEATPRTELTVVGVYEQLPGDHWFGERLTGAAAAGIDLDTMLTPVQTLTDPVTAADGRVGQWFQRTYAVDLPLRPGRVDVDRIGPLGVAVAEFVAYPMGVANSVGGVAATITVSSGLPAIAEEVRVGSAQAAVTVPLLMAQLGLLLAVVLWLVLVAAADQRRGEVAVARLRGRGFRGARRVLLAETLPPIVVGAPLGALLAAACVSLARDRVLTADPPFEVPAAGVVALVAGAAAMIALAVLSVRRVCREPVADLVRSVPSRRTGVRLGLLEAMLVAACGAAFLALATGSVDGPVGQVAPTLLGLAVGVVAARVVAFALAGGGRRLLRSGRPTAGAALLAASRRSTTRWVVPVVSVALCLVVVTADVLAVGVRNWAGRAAAEVGAPSVLTLRTNDLAEVVRVLRTVDPGGEQVTPVALLGPTARDGATTVGVFPDAFAKIALWPGVDPTTIPWDRLTAPSVPPLVLTGRRIGYRLDAPAFEPEQPVLRRPPTSLVLALRVVRADGTTGTVPLGPLPDVGAERDDDVAVDCAQGCRVTGLGVLAPLGAAAVAGSLTLTGLTVDGRPADLGPASSWRGVDDGAVTTAATVSRASAGAKVELAYANGGLPQAFLDHASLPDVVPALTTPAAAPSAVEATFAGSTVAGDPLSLAFAGGVTFVPGGPAKAALVHLDNLLVQGWRGQGSAVLAAYVGTADPAALDRLTAALAGQGIEVASMTRPGQVEERYGNSAAAWSLLLAVAVGVLSLLVAAVGIVVLAATSSRARARDYAGLRLVGLRPRGVALLAQLETLPVVAAAALIGAGVGLWAAPAAVDQVPLFTSPPATFPVDLGTAWAAALAAAAVGLAVVLLTGALTSAAVARRAEPGLLRDAG